MKRLSIVLLLFVQTSIAQTALDDTGFGEIRLGKTYELIENRINVVDVDAIPEYAWFAPMSLNYWLTEVEQDTASYYEMLETDRLITESLNLKIVWCSFQKKKDANFFKCPIECAQLIFENNSLKGIIVAFDKNDITPEAKESIFEQFEAQFGQADFNESSLSTPRRFDSNWKINERLIRVSDAQTMDGGIGETVQVLYWQ